jgi:hypothetical protein
MVSITSVAQYAYDGLGRRIMNSTSSETRYFYWSKDGQNLEERVGIEDAVDTYYIYGTRYVDELLFRGKDEFDDALVLQDANYNVTDLTVSRRHLRLHSHAPRPRARQRQPPAPEPSPSSQVEFMCTPSPDGRSW